MIASADQPLWKPTRTDDLPIARFAAEAEKRAGRGLADYDSLHGWSITDPAAFWDLVWDFCGVIGEKGERRLIDPERMPGARFFPDARLNYAENMLRRDDDGNAIVFRGEDKVRTRLSWRELNALVSRLQQALLGLGVEPGDRVAALMPNMPETIAAMLATASIGAVWSSASPDFGARGALDRFGQIAPKVLITCDGYYYAGKTIETQEKLTAIAEGLPDEPMIIVVPYLGSAAEVAAALPNGHALDDVLAPYEAKPVTYRRMPYAHPLYILFSSGTTGVPKCIVHSAGGTLLQHLKELHLQSSLERDERLFYFTTCGWMMWNWLTSGLGLGATLLLYDGSPFHPSERVLFDYAVDEGMNVFGTSAKYIDAVKKSGLRPIEDYDLSRVRMMLSTGSPLAPESFDFVYESIKPDIHLASISGGTDIVSCFLLGIPTKPVWRGELQGPGLGMAMDVFDETGKPLPSGKGELVCTVPFTSMPIGFWNDPDGERYRAAYFERFPGVWCHGDFAEWTEHGGMIIHGRSDATLNPGGVRIGTAEIYAQVESIPEVMEALAIGQEWEGDVRVVLFVRLRDGVTLDDDLIAKIKRVIRAGATPRHVPARVVAVADIPRTKSGKIVELAVREVVHNRPVKNRGALANPEALDHFANRPELAE
ncbi:acetoacetate--CoA ligase [Bauldia sp.]|uniref:acetoacetate--CoA ligase n=1 Tax=Bauldia sp. TaxID=2575872 RepID=UPI003BA8E207